MKLLLKNILLRNSLSLFFLKFFLKAVYLLLYWNKHLDIRSDVYISLRCNFGNYNRIYDGASLNKVTLSDFTYIGKNTSIVSSKVGKFCSIGPEVIIGLGTHPVRDFVSSHPVFYSTLAQSGITFADKDYFTEYNEIIIGNDVWIGARAILLGGITIGDGAIIAAGSVVTRDVGPYEIVGGIPAKVIGTRFSPEIISKLLKTRWWDRELKEIRLNYLDFHDVNSFS